MECDEWHIFELKHYIDYIGFTSYAIKCHGFAI